jgi:hypothetical protein
MEIKMEVEPPSFYSLVEPENKENAPAPPQILSEGNPPPNC